MTRQNVEGVLIIIACVVIILLGGYVIATCEAPPEPRERMERSLGSGAVCGEVSSDKATCLQGGRQFVCVRHEDRVACQEQP